MHDIPGRDRERERRAARRGGLVGGQTMQRSEMGGMDRNENEGPLTRLTGHEGSEPDVESGVVEGERERRGGVGVTRREKAVRLQQSALFPPPFPPPLLLGTQGCCLAYIVQTRGREPGRCGCRVACVRQLCTFDSELWEADKWATLGREHVNRATLDGGTTFSHPKLERRNHLSSAVIAFSIFLLLLSALRPMQLLFAICFAVP